MFVRIIVIVLCCLSGNVHGKTIIEPTKDKSCKDISKELQDDKLILPWETNIDSRDYSHKEISFTKEQIKHEEVSAQAYKQANGCLYNPSLFLDNLNKKQKIVEQYRNDNNTKDYIISPVNIHFMRQQNFLKEMNKTNNIEARKNKNTKDLPFTSGRAFEISIPIRSK